MKRGLFYLFFTLIIFSCNSSTTGQNTNSNATNESVKKNNQDLETRANYFYENKIYTKANLSYDTLISIDSTKGEYYFKRGYCKSMIPDNKGAIADYLLSIDRNYDKKYKAYLNIGVLHRGNAVFYSNSTKEQIAEYHTALYFYNECLKLDPDNSKAIKAKNEIIGALEGLE